MPSVTFRLPPTSHERLTAYCEKKGISISDFYREVTDRALDRIDDAAIAIVHTPSVRHVDRDGPKPIGFSAVDGSPLYAKTDRLRGPKAK